jgi:hypothetical protein
MSKVIHVDEIVHTLLTKNKFLSINLPKLIKREFLEEDGILDNYKSILEKE